MKLVDYTNPLLEIVLPPELLWTDEFDWSPVEVTTEFSVSGALLMQKGTKLAGRPITLKSPAKDSGWIDRIVMADLLSWSGTASKKMRLYLEKPNDTRNFVVEFGNDPVKASPVKGFANHEDDEPYTVEIKLIQVE